MSYQGIGHTNSVKYQGARTMEAVVDGKTVIYDINTTAVIWDPTLELFGDSLSELAAGLSYYIKS